MYKRIRHTVKEERFGVEAAPCPAPSPVPSPSAMPGAVMDTDKPTWPSPVAENKLATKGSIPESSVKVEKSTYYDNGITPLPVFLINEKTMLFRMDSRTLWTKYALGLVNLGVAEVNDIPNVKLIESRMLETAVSVGDFFTPYYGVNAGSQIGNYLTSIFKIGIDLMQSVKVGKDVEPYKIVWQPVIIEFARYLNQLNPAQWPIETLVEMFTKMTEYWTASIVARFNGDYIAGKIAIDGLNKVVVTGIANHFNKGYQSIADLLSRGIISQYPAQFTE